MATPATIGNGKIDEKLFKAVRLSIATLQAEGVHIHTLLAADIVVQTLTMHLICLFTRSA
jgi:soluble P-type ATPase